MLKKHPAFSPALTIVFVACLNLMLWSQCTVTVPDVTGKTPDEAKTVLERVALRCTIQTMTETKPEYKCKEGRVVLQSPAKEVKVSPCSVITLTVYQPKLSGFPILKPKPAISRPARITVGPIVTQADVDLSVLGSSGSGMLDLGRPLSVSVLKKGPSEIQSPVSVDWTVVDANGTPLKSGRLSIPPQNLLDLDKNTSGVFQQPSTKFSIPEYFDNWSCRVLLKVDPDNQIPETDENNNGYEFKFGNCQPLPAAGSAAAIDLVPEYDSSCLAEPDSYGGRKLMIRVANRGTQEFRRSFRYKIYLLRKGDLPMVGDRELSPGDLPLKPGEVKTIDPSFSLTAKTYETATLLAIALDTDYSISESDELNNFASYPFGLGQSSPESDPNARPDLTISFKEIKTPAKGCTDESSWTNPNTPDCRVKITLIVDNKGKASGPKAGKLGVEISVTDKDGKEIYVDTKDYEAVVAAGYNRIFNLEISPLIYFLKACRIKLTVDSENRVQEENEENNTATMDMPFCGQYPPAPDLRVDSLKVDKISTGGQEAFVVTAECENAGNTVGNPTFGFGWYLNGEKHDYQSYLQLTNFGDFPAPLQKFNVVTTVPFDKFPAGQDSVRLRFEIDSRANVKESNWYNNSKEIVLQKN